MTRFNWKRLMMLLASGATLLQVSSCTETAAIVGATSATVTAGGVLFILSRILNE